MLSTYRLYNIHENVLHLIGLIADRRYVEEIGCVERVKAAQCTLFATSRQFPESQNFLINPRLKILLLLINFFQQSQLSI
jgi:hypothetical protein